MTLQEELRESVKTIRVKSYPIVDLIPLLNRSADLIGGLEDLKRQQQSEIKQWGVEFDKLTNDFMKQQAEIEYLKLESADNLRCFRLAHDNCSRLEAEIEELKATLIKKSHRNANLQYTTVETEEKG